MNSNSLAARNDESKVVTMKIKIKKTERKIQDRAGTTHTVGDLTIVLKDVLKSHSIRRAEKKLGVKLAHSSKFVEAWEKRNWRVNCIAMPIPIELIKQEPIDEKDEPFASGSGKIFRYNYWIKNIVYL